MPDAKSKPKDKQTPEPLTLENCYSKVIEVYKARMTISVALMLATVTLTGYAMQNKRQEIFFLTAAVPVIALFLDLFTKYIFAVPFLYKAATQEFASGENEPTSLLFLDYGKAEESIYINTLELPSGRERQVEFRRVYMRRGLALKLFLFGSAAITEIALGLFVR